MQHVVSHGLPQVAPAEVTQHICIYNRTFGGLPTYLLHHALPFINFWIWPLQNMYVGLYCSYTGIIDRHTCMYHNIVYQSCLLRPVKGPLYEGGRLGLKEGDWSEKEGDSPKRGRLPENERDVQIIVRYSYLAVQSLVFFVVSSPSQALFPGS